MKIDLARLESDGEDFEGEEPCLLLDSGDEPDTTTTVDSHVRYALHVELVGAELIVRGRVAADVSFRCCRCCESFTTEVSDPDFFLATDLREAQEPVAPPAGKRRATSGSSHKGVSIPAPLPEFVDLTPDIRESILLAFPSHPVCDPGCKGLCAQCGVNWNREKCSCGRPACDCWDALDGMKL